MVLKRHQRIAMEHGEVTANNVMRHLRSVYNVTSTAHDEFPPNPVTILTQARAWFPERRRRSTVPAHALPVWWDAVMQEPGYARDFLLIALFTGMRRAEIASLRWEFVDLDERALHIPKTKNGEANGSFRVNAASAKRARLGGSMQTFNGSRSSATWLTY